MEDGFGPAWESDDEIENFIHKMNPPRVEVDNYSCSDATVVRIEYMNKNGILLEVVQVLIDLDLIITKAYISSDGEFFMDVFNVTNRDGRKIEDDRAASMEEFIRKSLSADSSYGPASRRSVGFTRSAGHTTIELTGTDRPGLLSEMSAVLTDLNCNVVDAEIWTHNSRAAAVMHVTDEETGTAITDPERLALIKQRLSYVLRGSMLAREARTAVAEEGTHPQRRLHQMMFDDHDYEQTNEDEQITYQSIKPHVSVRDWTDKDYSVVTIRCRDRPKLLFDTVCTLTDMKYAIFHANVDTQGTEAYQEFYVRRIDGSPFHSEDEREHVIQWLEAAIERRASEGVKLELCTGDKVGLLREVTRIFREYSLAVTRAEVNTRDGKAINTFYVRGMGGEPVEQKTIEEVRGIIGQAILSVKGQIEPTKSPQGSPTKFLLSGLFRARPLRSFGLASP